MQIVLSTIGKGGEFTLQHDLNFQAERYEAKHQVVSARITTLVSDGIVLIQMLDLPEPQA